MRGYLRRTAQNTTLFAATGTAKFHHVSTEMTFTAICLLARSRCWAKFGLSLFHLITVKALKDVTNQRRSSCLIVQLVPFSALGWRLFSNFRVALLLPSVMPVN